MNRNCPSLMVLLLLVAAVTIAQTQQPMTSGVVPVVAHLPGAASSYWTTDVYVTQTGGGSAAQLRLTILNPAGASWSRDVTLPAAGGAWQQADIVRFVNAAIPNEKYVMVWDSTQPVILTTRTATMSSGQSYGQGTGSLTPGSGFGDHGQMILPAPMDALTHRVNVGIANAGPAAQTFALQARDAQGDDLDSWTVSVPARAIVQLRTNDHGAGAGSVAATCTHGCDGNAYAYMSVVVNAGNDASFFYAAPGAGQSVVAPVTTTRDDRGVWYITGGTLYDAFEAMGYAVATDRLWQMETYRRSARGRLAEVLGPSQLASDVFLRTIGYTDAELTAAFDALDGETRTVVKAYVDGVNRRVAEVRAQPGILPFEFQAIAAQLGAPFVPEDWTVNDVLAWLALLQRNFDGEALSTGQLDNAALYQELAAKWPADSAAMFHDLRWVNDPDAVTYIPPATALLRSSAAPRVPPPANSFPDLRQAAPQVAARIAAVQQSLERINARVKLGSYGWVVAGSKTASGRPILYSGPQMGFAVPSVVTEGSIIGGGIAVSGMTVPGIPGIIIGRTPHHAWAMQTGHAHTVDYYLESPAAVQLHRIETIKVAGQADVTLPVYRTAHGPVINPMPYDPNNVTGPVVTWKYSHWGYEVAAARAFLQLARATSIAQFEAGVESVAASFHFEYADSAGNIAYWMSGRDPVRPAGTDPRLPLLGDGSQEWPQPVQLKPRSKDVNTAQGFYGGWNSKSCVSCDSSANELAYMHGPFHGGHVINDYFSAHSGLTFEEIRDFALNIATTDTFAGHRGVPWKYLEPYYHDVAMTYTNTPGLLDAITMLVAWDRHFVAGGPSEWALGTTRADAWVLQEEWVKGTIREVFRDELGDDIEPNTVLLNVMLRQLKGASSGLVNQYNWFRDRTQGGAGSSQFYVYVIGTLTTALHETHGEMPWNLPRGVIEYDHALLGKLHETPFANRSTYAHVVEMGEHGPTRIESMLPLGESGTILMNQAGQPVFDANFFSMTPVFDAFAPRAFPLFP
jgi:penicillin amidase